MSIIRSISLNKEQDDFLKENKNIKISHIVQELINDYMEKTKSVTRELEYAQKVIKKFEDFIVDNNLIKLWEDYRK